MNNRKKGHTIKAQVAIFIIVAIVIVGAIALVYIIKKNRGDLDNGAKAEIDSVKNSIQECMKFTAGDALDIIGVQGGYYNKQVDSYDLGWAFIPYYYNEGKFLMPQNSVIESELANYINDNLGICIESMNSFDYSLKYANPKTSVSIAPGIVNFIIDLPISATKDAKTTTFQLKELPVIYQSKLYEILEIAKYITDSHKEDPDMVCINCVADMAKEREVYVDMLNFDGNTTTLIVMSENVTLMGYSFEFLNKYPE